MALKRSLVCRLHAPGLRCLDGLFAWRGFLRLPNIIRYPLPDLRGIRSWLPAVVFSDRLSSFPAELAEAIRGPDPWFRVPVLAVLISRPSLFWGI